MAIKLPLVLGSDKSVQQLQSGDTIGGTSVTGVPPTTDDDYGTSFTIGSRALLSQPDRLTLTGTERATLNGTGRLQIFNSLAYPPLAFVYEPGSFMLNTGQQLRQYKRLRLAGNQRVTILNDARLKVWDDNLVSAWDYTLVMPASFTTNGTAAVYFGLPGQTFLPLDNSAYDIEWMMIGQSSTTAGMTINFNNLSGTGVTGHFLAIGSSSTSALVTGAFSLGAGLGGFWTTATTNLSVWLRGTIVTTTVGGPVGPQVNKSTSGTVTIRSSVLRIKKVG